MLVALTASRPPWLTLIVSPDTFRGNSTGSVVGAVGGIAAEADADSADGADGAAAGADLAAAGFALEARPGRLPLVRALGVIVLRAASSAASRAASASAPARVSSLVGSGVSRSAIGSFSHA
ncbi:MAG TPA: hypothetical protein VHM48_10500 [Candidatus Limnocylindrales bacterium]|nr:hypothetical protein [Candidatus Limnocylindrales bacterium]